MLSQLSRLTRAACLPATRAATHVRGYTRVSTSPLPPLPPWQPLLAMMGPGRVRSPIGDAILPPTATRDMTLPTVDEACAPLIFDGIPLGGLAFELPPLLPPAAPLEAKGTKGWHTFQPNVLKRKRTHGFLHRMRTQAGRSTLARRRAKGRHQLAVT